MHVMCWAEVLDGLQNAAELLQNCQSAFGEDEAAKVGLYDVMLCDMCRRVAASDHLGLLLHCVTGVCHNQKATHSSGHTGPAGRHTCSAGKNVCGLHALHFSQQVALLCLGRKALAAFPLFLLSGAHTAAVCSLCTGPGRQHPEAAAGNAAAAAGDASGNGQVSLEEELGCLSVMGLFCRQTVHRRWQLLPCA